MLKAGFIGAGGRAAGAHYPSVNRLENVSMAAVAELDEARGQRVVDRYNIPKFYRDHQEMLAEVDPDIVYCVMNEIHTTKPAIDCMNAGKHVFIEKPPGANADEAERLRDAAVQNDVYCAVGLQRRFASVTQEAMRLVNERGQPTLVTASFNKLLRGGPGNTTTLWNDVIHIVDLVRYMAQSEAAETTAYQDCFDENWRNCYTSMIRFENGATGIVMGNRISGGRVLRAELHGIGVGCYMRLPEGVEILADNQKPVWKSGADIAGCEAGDEPRYEGVLTMHEHFASCVLDGETPINDIRDVVHTARLTEALEGGAE